MSFIILGKNTSTNDVLVLDTSDLVVEAISEVDYDKAKRKGLNLVPFTKANSVFGISVAGNKYELFVHGCNEILFTGEFPTKCNRGDIFEQEIELTDFGRVGKYLCVLVVCRCWCKYDIEIPMVMAQIIRFPLKNLRTGRLSVFTSKPLYAVTSSIAKRQYVQCQGDYPSDCSVEPRYMDDTSLSGTCKLFGVDYGQDVPVFEDVCRTMKYIRLPE